MSGDYEGGLPIQSEGDLVAVRRAVRAAVGALGFGLTDVTRVVTAASELARNILRYAGRGEMAWRALGSGADAGIELVFSDRGPGIPDVQQALEAGYSSGGGLGMGLPGTRRLMDEMDLWSEVGRGTRVTVRKWVRRGTGAAHAAGAGRLHA